MARQIKIFLDFLKNNLAYRKEAWANWDPVDQTVLSNEQVIDGKGWRSGAKVERRKLPQWFFKITEYSEDLIQSLERMNDWPEKVKLMQSNWIGKSRGLEIKFNISINPVLVDLSDEISVSINSSLLTKFNKLSEILRV